MDQTLGIQSLNKGTIIDFSKFYMLEIWIRHELCVLPCYGSDLMNSQLEQGNQLYYLIMDTTCIISIDSFYFCTTYFCLRFGSELGVLPYSGSDLKNSKLEQGNHMSYLVMDQTLGTHNLNKGTICVTF